MTIILPAYAHKFETEPKWIYPSAHLLPALRMGVFVDGSGRMGSITPGPYQLILGYMQVSGGYRRVHRYLYIRTNADPWWEDDGSDNFCLPSSFKPREPMTEWPTEFDPGLGVLGPMKHALTRVVKEVKARWDRWYQNLGIRPPPSRDRWGETYDIPQF